MERGKRQALSSLFGGMGFYIALLLCVCAVGAAGYVWLFGEGETAEEPGEAVRESAAETVQPPAAVSVPVPQTQPVARPVTPAAPAAAVKPAAMPEAEGEEELPASAEPPAVLIVSPLIGETVAVFSTEMPLYNETTGDWRTHNGIDIRAEAGTAVVAASGGTVVSVEEDDRLGTVVTISHADGYESIYASLQEEVAVSVGERVSAGQRIAAVGNTTLTESALGAHLHFAVRKDGVSIDPDEFLERKA